MLKKIFQHKVFRNFSYLTIGSVISQLIGLVTVLKITSILQPGQYGLYTFIIAQGTLILTVGDLGIRNIVIRRIARDPKNTMDLVYNGALLRTIAMLGTSALYIGYNQLFGKLASGDLILVFLFGFISCYGKLFETAFLGHQKMLPPSMINLIFSVLWFGTIMLCPESLITVWNLMVAFLILNIFKNVVFYLIIKRLNLLQGETNNFLSSSLGLLRESWPYFILVLIMLPFTKFSNNFLDINSTVDELGYFNLSERFTGPVSFVLDFALVAIFPNLSAMWVSHSTKFIKVIGQGFKFYMLLGMVLCFLFTVFANDIFMLLFTSNYYPAIVVCQLQIWYLFLTSIDSLIGTILGSVNKEKKILQLGIVNSLISTPILFYSSKFGAVGLASGFVLSFAIFQFYLWYVFKKNLKIKIQDKTLMWIFAILLFSTSYFFISTYSIFTKLIISVVVVFLSGTFAYKRMANYLN
jgi:O-antigen/teichoic acid export membrane protein